MSTITSEKFFYIMDYSSHYYRVDAKDQLVAAGSEDEATIFTFADANRRIGAGLKSRFYFMTPVASDEDTEDEPAAEEEEKQGGLAETIISTVKEVTETKSATPIAAPVDEYDLSAVNWEDYLTNFSYIASNINCYKDELTQKLSEVDKKICDILHYIELCDTDEDDAQNLVDLLRTCREERRYLKDEIFKAEMFQKNVGTNANIAKVRDAIT